MSDNQVLMKNLDDVVNNIELDGDLYQLCQEEYNQIKVKILLMIWKINYLNKYFDPRLC